MNAFRQLVTIALIAGSLSGLVWFGLQYFAVIPLIEAAEKYEEAASHDHEDHDGHLARNSMTAAATVLTGIGFAALLAGVVSLTGQRLRVKSGALWGLAAFACVSAAPAIGLPPQPPGTAVADLAGRQVWWFGTVVATAVGIYLIATAGKRALRILAGVGCVLLPHVVGAPVAQGVSVVPASLVHQFEVASLATTGIFWITLGTVAGLLSGRVAEER